MIRSARECNYEKCNSPLSHAGPLLLLLLLLLLPDKIAITKLNAIRPTLTCLHNYLKMHTEANIIIQPNVYLAVSNSLHCVLQPVWLLTTVHCLDRSCAFH